MSARVFSDRTISAPAHHGNRLRRRGLHERSASLTGRLATAMLFVATLIIDLGCDADFVQGAVGKPVVHSEAPAPIDDENDLAHYVAQCEAVLGPIPEISCDPGSPAPGTHVTRIPVMVDGVPLGFGDAEDDALLAARTADGEYTCDFPSIGGDFSCAVGSTLVQYQDEQNPNVQWVGLCRGLPVDTVGYDRFIGNGLIGANVKTGEMCFFFAANPTPDAPYALPRLTSDVAEGSDLAPWLPPRDMPGSCLSCHPNNDPWVMTPWLGPEYMRQILENPAYPLRLPPGIVVDDLLAARFVEPTPMRLRALLPTPLPEGRTAWTEEEIFGDDGEVLLRQYRAVGSSYVANEAAGLVKPRTGIRPDSWSVDFRKRLMLNPMESSCSNGCHALANENFERIAIDSLGSKYAGKYLTDMMSNDAMPGFNWMPPVFGPADVWRRMFASVAAPSIAAITECPLPKRLDVEPDVEIDCDEGAGGKVVISWEYVNDYGDVPGRDDVRFDVAVGTGIDDGMRRGVSRDSEVEGVAMTADDDGAAVVHDVTADAGNGSQYRIELPFVGSQRTWTIDVQPKRYCFEEPDRRPYAYAVPEQIEVDIAAACD
ncbi:MAG: hypothetical protein IAG13_02695 [Deltaproteobacteria bacterium]|nr:hypothetical protein [Nannocystaceae bacterium]